MAGLVDDLGDLPPLDDDQTQGTRRRLGSKKPCADDGFTADDTHNEGGLLLSCRLLLFCFLY